MRSKKELLERGNYWLERMRADGFPISTNVTVEADHDQKKCFAYCHKKRGLDRYEVHLTPALAEIEDDIVDNTIIHELIHTCPRCWGHTGMFRVHGVKATSLYGLKYPIETQGDNLQSLALKRTRAYFEKSKLVLVNVESGEIIQSFKSSGTWMHRFATRVLKTPITANAEKWMLVKDFGKVLLTPMLSPSVTEENKKAFNEKFASLGLACYPMLPIMQTLTVHPRKPSVSATAKVKPQSHEVRVAAKAVSEPVVVYTGTTQLSLF